MSASARRGLEWIRTGAGSRLWPAVVAVLLGLCAIPLVLLWMPALDVDGRPLAPETPRLAPLAPAVVAATIPSVLAAAVVAGTLWGGLVRRHRVMASIGAILTAWAIGVAVLPLGPSIINERFIAGYWCIDGCSPVISSGDVASGLKALTAYPITIAAAPAIFIVLVAGVVLWAAVITGRKGVVQSDGQTMWVCVTSLRGRQRRR